MTTYRFHTTYYYKMKNKVTNTDYLETENLVLSNELIKVELPLWKIWKADVSRVSPSSEQIEDLWVLLVFMRVWGSFAIGGNMVTWICEKRGVHWIHEDRVYLVERWIFVLDFCGFLCFCLFNSNGLSTSVQLNTLANRLRLLVNWPGLLEAWLGLTSVKYHGNLLVLMPLNQRLALTGLRATDPRTLAKRSDTTLKINRFP